jgi:hypothetical protein
MRTVVIVLLATCVWPLTSGGAPADPPAKGASASELFAKVIDAAKIPDTAAEDVKKSKDNVKKWEATLKDNKKVDPVLVIYTVKYITPAVVEKALGKPDRKTEAEIPGILTGQGEKIKGPVYWYGPIGFNFGKTKVDDKEGEYLFVIRYEAK